MSHFTETAHCQVAKPHQPEHSVLAAATSEPVSHDEGVQTLRLRLKALNAWPAAGDTFLELLSQVRGYGVTLVPADYDWLAQVAHDACNGEDIGLRYPSIFQKLLTFPELRQKFLQTLQLHSNPV